MVAQDVKHESVLLGDVPHHADELAGIAHRLALRANYDVAALEPGRARWSSHCNVDDEYAIAGELEELAEPVIQLGQLGTGDRYARRAGPEDDRHRHMRKRSAGCGTLSQGDLGARAPRGLDTLRRRSDDAVP